jgi:hypothetical protein
VNWGTILASALGTIIGIVLMIVFWGFSTGGLTRMTRTVQIEWINAVCCIVSEIRA